MIRLRKLNLVLFAAVCLAIGFLAAQSDPAPTAATVNKDPNPMKGNAQQYARMQPQDIKFASR
jgi:hypothetical protein